MVPSSTVFEMYPLGFLTIASHLHAQGMDVRIVNLALRMMNSRRFDVPAFIARQRPRAVGIDLHWLPHAHGALEVARIVKEIHPGVPVIFGGLSSSYFHEELAAYPQVDFVLRGDSTEPPLHQRALRDRLESLLAQGGKPADDPALRGEISDFSMSTVCDKRELFWRRGWSQFRLIEVVRILGRALYPRDHPGAPP